MKTVMLAVGIGGAVLAAGLSVAAPANAACSVANPNWGLPANVQQWIANASLQELRNGYTAGRCEIKSTLHKSGDDCIDGSGNNHVVVEVWNRNNQVLPRFHVFDYTININGTVRQCATQ